MKIVITDTGCANIASVKFAIERLGYQPVVSADHDLIRSADKVLLPGVGSANEAMKNLKQRGLDTLLPTLTQPVLGICLGMQLMSAFSHEGEVECLKLVPTEVDWLPTPNNERLPHMGWNTITPAAGNPLFAGIPTGSYFYFVHSFRVPVGEYTIAECEYGTPFSAAVQHGNFYGVQFHPERSAEQGAQLLKNFIEL